ncbi:MAG: hypothetical protein EBW61_15550 [Rhodobacteraceae bacterium]|nr:hypothetical protein [Paracoccaceae bacterium]
MRRDRVRSKLVTDIPTRVHLCSAKADNRSISLSTMAPLVTMAPGGVFPTSLPISVASFDSALQSPVRDPYLLQVQLAQPVILDAPIHGAIARQRSFLQKAWFQNQAPKTGPNNYERTARNN